MSGVNNIETDTFEDIIDAILKCRQMKRIQLMLTELWDSIKEEDGDGTEEWQRLLFVVENLKEDAALARSMGDAKEKLTLEYLEREIRLARQAVPSIYDNI